MKLHRIIIVMPIITGLISGYSCTNKLPEKPNILFITTDYQAWEDVPELTPVLKMPALDRLYKEGLVFENHYCTAPVCMPSRYTIVSGTYPHTHGLWDNLRIGSGRVSCAYGGTGEGRIQDNSNWKDAF